MQTTPAQVALNLLVLGVRGVFRKLKLRWDTAARQGAPAAPERTARLTQHALPRARRLAESHTRCGVALGGRSPSSAAPQKLAAAHAASPQPSGQCDGHGQGGDQSGNLFLL